MGAVLYLNIVVLDLKTDWFRWESEREGALGVQMGNRERELWA